jgi:hypothetical protein
MKKISSRVGKIALAAEGYPSEELIAAIQALFGRVNSECVGRANEAAAAGAEGQELIDILLGDGCLVGEEVAGDEISSGGRLLAWAVGNPGKAVALGIGTTAAGILGSWLISHLIKRGKIKRTILQGAEKIRRLQEISAGIERGESYRGVPDLVLSGEEIRYISDRDPALIAMDEDKNIVLKISNPTNVAYELYQVIFDVKYYKKGEDLRKPYFSEAITYQVSPNEFSSGNSKFNPGETRKEIFSLKGVPTKFKTSSEAGTIMSISPAYAYFRFYNKDLGYGKTESKISLNPGNMSYSVSTLLGSYF